MICPGKPETDADSDNDIVDGRNDNDNDVNSGAAAGNVGAPVASVVLSLQLARLSMILPPWWLWPRGWMLLLGWWFLRLLRSALVPLCVQSPCVWMLGTTSSMRWLASRCWSVGRGGGGGAEERVLDSSPSQVSASVLGASTSQGGVPQWALTRRFGKILEIGK